MSLVVRNESRPAQAAFDGSSDQGADGIFVNREALRPFRPQCSDAKRPLMKRYAWLAVVCTVSTPVCSLQPAGANAPKVIYWLTIDALRADVIGRKYGENLIMPNLTGFAAESVYFGNAYSQSSFTKTSTAAMFTGLWPSRLGVKGCQVQVAPTGAELCFGLDPRFPTLAGFLQDRGYRAITHPYTIHVREGDGLVNGFEMHASIPESLPPGRLFVYQHILGLHAPYAPSAAATERLGVKKATRIDPASLNWFFERLTVPQAEELRSYYFAEGYDADLEFLALTKRLKAQGVWDEAMVIVTADHGEEFLEHGGIQHSHRLQLYNEVLRVPLFIKFPKSSGLSSHHGRTFENRVRLVDLFPTIKDLLGAKDDAPSDGLSLLPIVRGEEPASRLREVIAQLAGVQPSLTVYEARAIIMDEWKAVMGYRLDHTRREGTKGFGVGEPYQELYDLSTDPRETRNLRSERDAIFKSLEHEYWRRAKPVPYRSRDGRSGVLNALAESAPDREEREKELRALGYIR